MNNRELKEKLSSAVNHGGEEQGGLSLRVILETARAVQHIRTLEKLNGITMEIGNVRVGLRRAMPALSELCCDPRRIIALMLYAADNPDWAWVNFWAVFCPEISVKRMAKLRKINSSTVLYYLEQTELPSDAYEFIPENR